MLIDNEKITRGVPAICSFLGKYALVAFLVWAMFCLFKFFFLRFGMFIGATGILCAIITVSLIIALPFLAKR